MRPRSGLVLPPPPPAPPAHPLPYSIFVCKGCVPRSSRHRLEPLPGRMAACGTNSNHGKSSTTFSRAIADRTSNSAAATSAAAAAAAAAVADGARSVPTLVDDDSAVGDLRSSCDRCWQKKRKCTGERPCGRCKRGGVHCSYSTKRKLGRPRMSILTGAAASESGKEGSDVSSPSTTKKTKQDVAPSGTFPHAGTGVLRAPNSNNSSNRSGSSSSRSGSSSSHNRGSTSGSGDIGRGRCSASTSTMSTNRPAFSASLATGLAGLPESRFLSCFLEHFAPM